MRRMIDLHYWTTPNGHKITLFLEEAKVAYKDYINRYPKGKHVREAKDINKLINSNSKNLSK